MLIEFAIAIEPSWSSRTSDLSDTGDIEFAIEIEIAIETWGRGESLSAF